MENNNINNDFVKSLLKKPVLERFLSFLNPEKHINFLKLCKPLALVAQDKCFRSLLRSKIDQMIQGAGFSFEFDKNSRQLKSYSISRECEIEKDYYNKTRTLYFLKQIQFIDEKVFLSIRNITDDIFIRCVKSRFCEDTSSTFLFDMFNEILNKSDETLFFKCLRGVRKLIEDDKFQSKTDKQAATIKVTMDSNVIHLVTNLLDKVYENEKNMKSVFDFAASFLNSLFYDDKGYRRYKGGIDKIILRKVFYRISGLAKENNDGIEFKCLVDFLKKTKCLDWVSTFDSDDFLKAFKGQISNDLENSYSPKVTDQLKKKLGKDKYLSLWKKENRRNRSVGIANRKPKCSERVNRSCERKKNSFEI